MRVELAACLGLCLLCPGCAEREDTALKRAASRGDAAAVEALLAAGSDPEQSAAPGWTPVILAARSGHAVVVERLLRAGASVDRCDEGPNRWTPLVHAIHKRRLDAVRVLLRHGALPDRRLEGGATALMFAAAYGQTPVVEELLAYGADPTLEAAGGVSALANAAGGGAVFDFSDGPPLGTCHAETVRVLLRHHPRLRLRASSIGSLSRWWGRRSPSCQSVQRLLQAASS